MKFLFYRFLYRPLMKIAHRYNWHYAPAHQIEGDTQRWCQWCGMRHTTRNGPYIAALLLLCVLGSSAACHAPVTIVTPQGQTAYTADQIVVRVNELMNAAIAANASGALDTATTRTLVSFSVDADKVLAATPAGWVGTLQTAWSATKARLTGVTNPAIVAAMSAVDVALGVIQ